MGVQVRILFDKEFAPADANVSLEPISGNVLLEVRFAGFCGSEEVIELRMALAKRGIRNQEIIHVERGNVDPHVGLGDCIKNCGARGHR